jgi:hypothetical protein
LHCCFTHSSTHHIYIQYVPTVALLFHTQHYPPYLYTVPNDICTAVSHTAVPTLSIYSTYSQLHCGFTHSCTHHIYIQYVPTVALLFQSQQYPPYLYTVRTNSCTAVPYTAVFTISIYSKYRPLLCSFTNSSTHHIYIQYVLTVLLLFHTQQYPPYLYTVHTDSFTDVSHTSLSTISLYSMYRQLHFCFTHSSNQNIYVQYLPTVALLFHTQHYPLYLYIVRTVSCTAVSHTAVPTISICSTY